MDVGTGPNHPDHIAIIDDDTGICRLLDRYFSREGFAVSIFHDAESLWARTEDMGIDVALVDLNLPGEDGLGVTRRLKQDSDTGIIILTGKSDEIDRVVGLELGADDYVSKPFSNRELLARVRSVLRRVHELRALRQPMQQSTPASAPDTAKVLANGLTFDARSRTLVNSTGKTSLTELECDLLTYLTNRPDEPLRRQDLCETVMGRAWDPEDRSIDVHIANLRRKLDSMSPDHKLISTLRGVGYMFQPPALQDPS